MAKAPRRRNRKLLSLEQLNREDRIGRPPSLNPRLDFIDFKRLPRPRPQRAPKKRRR
jgi:hypothetical protein